MIRFDDGTFDGAAVGGRPHRRLPRARLVRGPSVPRRVPGHARRTQHWRRPRAARRARARRDRRRTRIRTRRSIACCSLPQRLSRATYRTTVEEKSHGPPPRARSTPAPATTARPAWATARACRRRTRASRRTARSTRRTARSAWCSRCRTCRRRSTRSADEDPARAVRSRRRAGGAGLSRDPRQRTSMQLEQCLDRFNEPLPPLKEFILPGGGPAAAACHLARAITRRAERCAWALAQTRSGRTGSDALPESLVGSAVRRRARAGAARERTGSAVEEDTPCRRSRAQTAVSSAPTQPHRGRRAGRCGS